MPHQNLRGFLLNQLRKKWVQEISPTTIINQGFIKTDMTNVLDESIQTGNKKQIPLKSF